MLVKYDWIWKIFWIHGVSDIQYTGGGFKWGDSGGGVKTLVEDIHFSEINIQKY